jgi:hypothetical protein
MHVDATATGAAMEADGSEGSWANSLGRIGCCLKSVDLRLLEMLVMSGLTSSESFPLYTTASGPNDPASRARWVAKALVRSGKTALACRSSHRVHRNYLAVGNVVVHGGIHDVPSWPLGGWLRVCNRGNTGRGPAMLVLGKARATSPAVIGCGSQLI